MKKLNHQVGKTIKSLRIQKGLTQEELAEASGIHDKHIGRIERGIQGISLEYLQKLAKGLNVHVAELVKIIFLLETSEVKKDLSARGHAQAGKDWLLENINAILRRQSAENLKSLHHILLQLPAMREEETNGAANKKKAQDKG